MRYAAILLSRQPLRPTGRTEWVRRSVAAMRWLQSEGLGLVSSVGLQTWELLTSLASDLRLPLVLVIPSVSEASFLGECDLALAEFNLDHELTRFVRARSSGTDTVSAGAAERDRAVVVHADLLLPICCRPGGTMEALLAEADVSGRDIDKRFILTEADRSMPLKYDLSAERLNLDLEQVREKYLIHWTRSVSQPWPDERKVVFYREVIRSDRWTRTAFDTLLRIAKMQRIIASGRHMPGKVATVSLSGLNPAEVIPLMRWRARYSEMSFEPYGVGIERLLAERLGVQQVRYHASGSTPDCSGDDRWLWQSNGQKSDWRAEQEFRHLGDFDLNLVPIESLVFFCRTSAEAEQLRAIHNGPIWPLFL
ncbi:MAG: hypothetical protein AB1772_01730 [Candidatus Zixiibacteriota bacterium]